MAQSSSNQNIRNKKLVISEVIKNEEISSAGMLYLYLIGKIVSDNKIQIQQVNTSKNVFDFYDKSKELKEGKAKDCDIELFCVLGMNEKIEKIVEIVDRQIKNNFERILKENDVMLDCDELDFLGNDFNKLIQEHIFPIGKIKFPRIHQVKYDTWKMYCFWAGDGPEDESHLLIDDAIGTWIEYEKPMIYGKQIMNQSFQLSDLTGRKIIGILPNIENGEWIVLLDGGVKLQLNSEVSYSRERVGIKDLGSFTIGDIDTILNNPTYVR